MIDDNLTKSVSSALRPAEGRDRALFWWTALPLLVIDQLTKWWITSTIPLYESRVPIAALFPYYKHTHIPNIGSVFGTNQSGAARPWLTILAIVVAVALIVYNQRLDRGARKLRFALGLVLAGGVGNLIDRVRLGHVTDFVDLDFTSIIPIGIADWYIFNVADACVVFAICLMAYMTFFEPEQIEGEKAFEDQAKKHTAVAENNELDSAEIPHTQTDSIVADSTSTGDAALDQLIVDQELSNDDV